MLISHSLTVDPTAVVSSYRDYWGAYVETFDVHVPHRNLMITAMSTLDTPDMSESLVHLDWEHTHSIKVQDKFAEYLGFTTYVDDPCLDPQLVDLMAQLKSMPNPLAAVERAVAAIRE